MANVTAKDPDFEWLELDGELFYRKKTSQKFIETEYNIRAMLWRKYNVVHISFTLLYEKEGRYQEWRVNGKLHRIGGPAYVHYEDERWYKNGVLHREDGPAFINNAGDKMLYIEGKLHRNDGHFFFRKNDGPAIKFSNGNESWYRHGLLHNEHGPAKIGTKRVEFFHRKMMMKRAQ